MLLMGVSHFNTILTIKIWNIRNELVYLHPKLNDMKPQIGQTITANLLGKIVLTGKVTGIGEHKGKICYDIILSDGSERFVYENQITKIHTN